jgi:hypothetical protein
LIAAKSGANANSTRHLLVPTASHRGETCGIPHVGTRWNVVSRNKRSNDHQDKKGNNGKKKFEKGAARKPPFDEAVFPVKNEDERRCFDDQSIK